MKINKLIENYNLKIDSLNQNEINILNTILENKNDFSEFCSIDLPEIYKNCKCNIFIYFKNNFIKILFYTKNISEFKCDFESFLVFNFNYDGKMINNFIISEDGEFTVEINEFNKLNMNFLNFMKKYNIYYGIKYYDDNIINAKKDYKNKDYTLFQIKICLDKDLNNSYNKYNDINKLYNDFMSGNFNINNLFKN